MALDNLPLEIYNYYIFDYLTIDDLLELKLVNKKLNLIVNQFKIQELNIQSDYNHFKDRSWYTNNPINFKYNLSFLKKSLLKTSSNLKFNLKRLKVSRVQDGDPITLIDINMLKNLEELKIRVWNCKTNENKKLSLLRLKILELNTNSPIEIHTPSLIALNINNHYFSLKNLEIINPTSIKYLKLSNYEKIVETIFNSNLQYLECDCFYDIDVQTFLIKFYNLKELRILNDNRINFMYLLFELKNEKMKVFYRGIELINLTKFEELRKLIKSYGNTLSIQLSNYELLDYNLNYVDKINYNEVINLINHNVLTIDQFFKKYSNIRSIIIKDEIENQNELNKFIKSCYNLDTLTILRSNLDQSFYDNLPIFTSLSRLEITENTKLNFEFISRMFNLRFLITNLEIKISKCLNLNRLRNLQKIEFKTNDKLFTIYKNNRNNYTLEKKNKKNEFLKIERLDLNQLIQCCNYWNC